MKEPRILNRLPLILLISAMLCLATQRAEGVDGDCKPNVLFIAVDDLNNWVGHIEGHPNVKTPNIDRLANRGISFARAYCSAPLCNPSRVSLLTGIAPYKSGVYGNGERLRDKLPNAITLMQHFRASGYSAGGAGKIFHARKAYDNASWDDYFRPNTLTMHHTKRDSDLPESAWVPWGPLTCSDDEMFDGKTANWIIAQLEKPQEKPFFLAYGLTKPHLTWEVPQKYFDLHPIEGIKLPLVKENDLDDLPAFGQKLAREVYDPSGERNFATPGGDHQNVIANKQWPIAVQAYLATISFADAQIGRVLDALEKSGHAENTIIVLWGDHGWHLGEKEHWRKHALWDVTTRTPLIISVPEGVNKGQLCHRPVSLIDIYPTLIDLCGLPKRDGLDGQSLIPLLKNPNQQWQRPVLITFGFNNHAIQTQRWRYIRYNTGGEELYDHSNDPHEWTNLARNPEYAAEIKRLSAHLPKTNYEAKKFLGCANRVEKASDWYEADPMAKKLSQLLPEEIEMLDGSALLHHKPAILPKPEYVVSGNDYFDWPIATKVDDTIVVLFDRRHYHGGKPKDGEIQWDENSGIRMISTSSDGGRTWSDPLDVLEQAGMWETTIFDGWGGGLGSHNGVVYLALNEGIYHSQEKGKTWALITPEPDFSKIPGKVKPTKEDYSSGANPAKVTTSTFWSPSTRLTFDEAHGLTLWSTRDFKPSNRNKGEAEERNTNYGKYLCAIYSKDFGKSWEFEEQAIPEGVTLTEITPLQHDGKLVFFLRNGILRSYYAQAYSGSGWFPFEFAVTNVGSMHFMDTPDVIFNPVTQRYEAAVTNRTYRLSGVPMELQLWSIAPDEWAAGSATWRFEGVLLRYSSALKSDGMNPVASIIDEEAGVQRIYIWGGTVQEESGIFEYSRSLDTPAVSKYLKSSRP